MHASNIANPTWVAEQQPLLDARRTLRDHLDRWFALVVPTFRNLSVEPTPVPAPQRGEAAYRVDGEFVCDGRQFRTGATVVMRDGEAVATGVAVQVLRADGTWTEPARWMEQLADELLQPKPHPANPSRRRRRRR